MTEGNLLQNYATRRDPEAFAEIVRRYQRLVFSACRRKLHNPGDVDDAVQETFLRLAQRAGELHTNLGAWLHRCAVNVATDLNRRRDARKRHESVIAIPPGETTSEDAQRALVELREHLDAALEKIGEADRELIVQRYFVGRPQTELAAEAGVSPSTLSHRLDRAIEALRAKLSASGCVAATGGGAAFLAQSLQAESASAAVPAALTANLMKIGLTGAPVPAAGVATAAGGVFFSTAAFKAILAVAATMLIATGVWVAATRSSSAGRAAAAPASRPAAVTLVTDTAAKVPDAQAPAEPPKWVATAPSTQPAVLAGRVLDRAGKPIAGATVELRGPTFLQAKTDADGNYRFTTLSPARAGAAAARAATGGEYRIGVTAPNFLSIDAYRSKDSSVQLTRDAEARRDFILDRGVPVTVTVVDALGEPIKGASVDVNVAGTRGQNVGERQTTDDLGTVRLSVPASSTPYVIGVSGTSGAPAHATVAAKSVDTPVEVTVTSGPALTIKGKAICSDGKPAAGWGIVAYPDWWASYYVPKNHPIDADGNFTLTAVGPGRYNLSISIPTGEGSSTSQSVGSFTFPLPPNQPLVLNLPMASPSSQVKVTGKIRLTGDRPDYIQVTAMGLNDSSVWRHTSVRFDAPPRRPNAKTPATKLAKNEAVFTFENVPPGAYRISFESPAITPKVLENVQIPGGLPEVIDLVATGKPRLTGRVVDPDGKRVSHYAIRVRKTQTLGKGPSYVQDDKWIQVSNPEGKFDVELVGPGVYQAQASAEGFAWTWGPEIRIEQGGKPASFDLKLSAGGALAGKVVDASDKPVAGAKVIPLSRAMSTSMGHGEVRFGSDAGAAVTDANGQFTLKALPPGDETIKVVHPNFAPLIRESLKVTDGQTTGVAPVALEVGGSVEGVVYDAAGKPVPAVALQFQDDSGYSGGGDEEAGRLATATTDENGYYRVDHLPEQPIWVNLADRWERGGTVRRFFHPVNGKTTRLDFGGIKPITGRILTTGGVATSQPTDGSAVPLANTRIELAIGSPHFSPSITTATTDAQGKFTFFSPPTGNYTLYVQRPGDRSEWTPLKAVQITSDLSTLGDINLDAGEVVITLAPEVGADAKSPRYVSISTDEPNRQFQEQVAVAVADAKTPGVWRAASIPAGKFRVNASYTGDDASVSLTLPFTRSPGERATNVTVRAPAASAMLKVKWAAPTTVPSNVQSYFTLRSSDSTMSLYVPSDKADGVTVKVLPGTYVLQDGYADQPRADAPPITVGAGETREVIVPAAAQPATRPTVYVSLAVWSPDGSFVANPAVTLAGTDGTPIADRGNYGTGPSYTLAPGTYKATITPVGGAAQVHEITVPAPQPKPTRRTSTIDVFLR